MTMSTTTTRLDEIAQRQRTSRSRDLAFAILIAFVMIFQISSLRAAVAKTNQPVAKAAAALTAPAQQGATPVSCAAPTPVC
jgi:hypothetical protein